MKNRMRPLIFLKEGLIMDTARKYDYLEPIEISKGIYWVGFYDEVASFHCNPYLLIDGEEAIIFDPGSIPSYPMVASKVLSLVEPDQIKYIVAHHQDPDLCANIPLFEELIRNDDLKIVTHSRAALLINYYGTKSTFYNIDNNNNEPLVSGKKIRESHPTW
jgi:flavorubredoxin